jgi:hypothetical protein
MRSADAAMYRAKNQGRGEYQFADNDDGEFTESDMAAVGQTQHLECKVLGARTTPDLPSEGTSA